MLRTTIVEWNLREGSTNYTVIFNLQLQAAKIRSDCGRPDLQRDFSVVSDAEAVALVEWFKAQKQ